MRDKDYFNIDTERWHDLASMSIRYRCRISFLGSSQSALYVEQCFEEGMPEAVMHEQLVRIAVGEFTKPLLQFLQEQPKLSSPFTSTLRY